MKTPITTSKIKCPNCKHDAHVKYECMERVVDAAGDVDYCSCSRGVILHVKVCPFAVPRRAV